jgi:TonB family protein
MTRVHVAFLVTVGVAAFGGSAVLQAQDAQATASDPISPTDCLKDKKKAPECQRLGLLYADGREVAQDEPRAIQFLDSACRAGLIGSCSAQGWLLLKLHQRPEDAKRGEQLLGRGCAEGAPVACDMLGRAYASGIGVTRDPSKAAKLLNKACDADVAESCSALAELLETGDGVPRDAERARALARKACAVGSRQMCEKACDAGNGSACVALGDRLAQVKDSNTGRVKRAYERACNAAAAEGCYDLGLRTKDPEEALPVFQRACSLEDPFGCLAVAQYYHVGRGVEVALDRAARLYEQACGKDVAVACRALGGMYARGELGDDGKAKGQAYFVKACGGDVECGAIVANGRIPNAWGGSLEVLRPPATATAIEATPLWACETVEILGRVPDLAPGSAPGAWPTGAGGACPAGPTRVGGSIQASKKIRNVPPIYPNIARMARIQGTVVLVCIISPRGEVGDIRVTQSVPLLDPAAIQAVRQWRYTSALLDGRPVPLFLMVTMTFTIS